MFLEEGSFFSDSKVGANLIHSTFLKGRSILVTADVKSSLRDDKIYEFNTSIQVRKCLFAPK